MNSIDLINIGNKRLKNFKNKQKILNYKHYNSTNKIMNK